MQSNFSVFEGLGFSSEGIVDIASDNQNSFVSPTKQHYINKAKELIKDVDKVYFSGEFPSVYFKIVEKFDAQTLALILEVHKRIWNQGKVAFLYVESSAEIRIYNCYEKPIKPGQEDRNFDEIELFSASKQAEKDLAILRDVFGMVSIETGDFWQNIKYAQKLNHQRRVEQALMENLKKTRVALKNQGLSGVHGKTIIHDLLLRSLFILYLEDRKATNTEFYSTFKPGAKSYFDLLEDVEGTYKLFSKLEDSFNGNLSPVSQEERQIVNSNHLQLIKECFWSKLKENGQTRLFDWRIFDFEVIPIELISAIYEDFLAEKEGTENQEKTGAFYTPRPLVEFILNKVLPHPSEHDHRHNVKILDPTCGSGIFLVESLNRLLDRWEYINEGKKPDFETIKQITLDNIFGVDIQPDAIKVAAFSLYLAMLNRLDPKTLWPSTRFPYLIFDPNSEDKERHGKNLFIQSSIQSGDFEKINFDLIVGNPPFGRGKLDKHVSEYLAKRDFPQENVISFLCRAIEIAPQGQIALVFAAKILFNKDRTYKNFRRFLIQENAVSAIYNFAALRRLPKSEGGNFFATAVNPVGVLFYSKDSKSHENHIIYCAPKSSIKSRLVDGILIDPGDFKFLPVQDCLSSDSIIWKTAMWGTERDFHFIKKLLNNYPSLKSTLTKYKWLNDAGAGFQTSFPLKYNDQTIKELPFLDASNIERYYSLRGNTTQIENEKFHRLGNKKSYTKPHLLIKAGQSDKKFCASYIDFDCSFRKTIYGIHSVNEEKLKLLTAFLNSSLATYLLFLSPSSWGVEREEVKPGHILDLPDLCFSLPQEFQNRVVELVDQIIQLKKKQLTPFRELESLESQIDEIFYLGLGYTTNERILIEDLINYNLDAFQEKQKSKAYHPVISDEENNFANLLCKTLNEFLAIGSKTTCWATIFETSSRLPLKAIAINFNKEQAPAMAIKAKWVAIHETLKAIETYTYRQYSESLYFRKFVRYYTADRIYIIKPNQKLFWSGSQALNDADEIIAEILAMKK